MTLMKQLASADFRKTYTAQSEPVEVTAHGKVIGTWIPFDRNKPVTIETRPSEDVAPEAPDVPARMTIRPVKGPNRQMVGTSQRVLDPLEAARVERAAYSRFAKRAYGTKVAKD